MQYNPDYICRMSLTIALQWDETVRCSCWKKNPEINQFLSVLDLSISLHVPTIQMERTADFIINQMCKILHLSLPPLCQLLSSLPQKSPIRLPT